MRNLKARLKSQGGFTLIEMLVVVALIAILIAIAVPMITSSLERGREATDDANERSAIGLAYVEIMSDNNAFLKDDGTVQDLYYAVSNDRGTLSAAKPTDSLGRGTPAGDNAENHVGCIMRLVYNNSGTATDATGTCDNAVKITINPGDVGIVWDKLS